MWFFSFLLSCFDSPSQQVLQDTSFSHRLDEVEPEKNDARGEKKENLDSTETLVKTSVLILALGNTLKIRSDTEKIEVVQPFLRKQIYSGNICGMMVKVIEEHLDIKGERQEKREKQLERIKHQRDTKKKRLTENQQKSLQDRADKAFEEFDVAIENTGEKQKEPALLAEHTIVHQALPKQPCAKQVEKLQWVQMTIDSKQYSVERSDSTYKCVDGEFTEDIEKIEIRGMDGTDVEVFSTVRENCLLQEKGLSRDYSILIEEKSP